MGFVLGSERFQQEIAALVGRRTWRGHPGRPIKSDEDKGTCSKNVVCRLLTPFLGYQVSLKGLQVAKETLQRAQSKVARLLEQNASKQRIEQYWRRFVAAVKGKVPGGVGIDIVGLR